MIGKIQAAVQVEPKRGKRVEPGSLLFHVRHFLGVGALALILATEGFGQSPAANPGVVPLAPVVVSAARTGQDFATLPVTVEIFGQDRLRNSPGAVIDDVLRDDPAFSLFRRTGSATANPTAQGVSLRALGPSGASRSLVLLDGVPLNDPFGGWVTWSQVPRESVLRAEIVRGGGSGVWGNSALGGVVQLFTVDPLGPHRARTDDVFSFEAGDYGTFQGELALSAPAGGGALRADFQQFRTDGFRVVGPADRGLVDLPLDSTHRSLSLGWNGDVTQAVHGGVTLRGFDEDRGNGTPLQRNRSRSGTAAFTLAGATGPDRSWQFTGYVQRQSFAAFFTGVNADRTAETPANDQFDVPATAAGAAWSTTWRQAAGVTTVGLDYRWVEGESREDYLYTVDRFSRRRKAGGEQSFGGGFLHHDRALGDAWHATVDLRLDRWLNTAGHRQESDLSSGAILRDDHYAADQGTEVSPQLGLVWTPAPGWRMRGAVYRAFRVPTLNEYYRPFRVGIVSTEANPALAREELVGGEVSAEYSGRTGRVGVTVYDQELGDAVGQATLSSSPSLIARQRQNIDEIAVKGLELDSAWSPAPGCSLRLAWLLSDARVRSNPIQPALEGRRLPQVPRQSLVAGVDWMPAPGWRMTARVRHASQQFEDDENLLPLAPATTVDLRLSRQWSRSFETYVAVENAFDAAVETGRSSVEFATLGAPRLVRAGIRATW